MVAAPPFVDFFFPWQTYSGFPIAVFQIAVSWHIYLEGVLKENIPAYYPEEVFSWFKKLV